MRALLNVSAILFPTLFLSTAAAVAQAREFASGSGLAVDSLGNVWITNKLGSFEHGPLGRKRC